MLVLATTLAVGSPESFAAQPSGRADVGRQGDAYGAGASAPTAKEPESKLWFQDGAWWGVLFARDSQEFRIHRLDPLTLRWADVGITVDARARARIDALWDGARLYTLAHVWDMTAGGRAELRRFGYDPATGAYTPDVGFPVAVNTLGTESAVLAKDSDGTLWATFTQDARVYVNRSRGGDSAWATPFPLAVAGAEVTDDDISTMVAFGSAVGVMWSNQGDGTVYFAVHADGAPDDAWAHEIAYHAPNGEGADDHMNLKADSAGRVYAAAKTAQDGPAELLVHLLVRDPGGAWTSYPFSTVADNHTRPIVQVDEAYRRVYVFAAAPCCAGGVIYFKRANLDAIAFPPGPGTAFIRSELDPEINNPTGTKQVLERDGGMLVLASDDSTRRYVHNRLGLAIAAEAANP